MSDEDSDAEAQGADALRLLKQCSRSTKGVARKLSGAPTSGDIDSAPLVSLIPASKRSRTPSQDLNDICRPSGFQKVKSGSLASTFREHPGNVHGTSHKEKEFSGQRSAPDQIRNYAKELRSCRSAPDLTIPALAAIRGLQDGSLQVDRQTRIKIAAAAKRVLEGRELKRRASQEQEAQARILEASAASACSPGHQAEPSREQPKGNSSAPNSTLRRLAAGDPGSSVNSAGPHRMSSSLGPVPFAASSQYTAKPPPPYNATSPEASSGNFHRPALGSGSPGVLLSASHPPFTVTTGLPKFSIDNPQLSDSSQAQASKPPKVPAESHSQEVSKASPYSKTLSLGDILRSDPGAGH